MKPIESIKSLMEITQDVSAGLRMKIGELIISANEAIDNAMDCFGDDD